MTHKVGPKGQVVIPKEIRDRLGIHPGDEVVFLDDGPGGVRIERAGDIRDLAGMFSGSGMAEELLAERRRDREKEERRIREYGG